MLAAMITVMAVVWPCRDPIDTYIGVGSSVGVLVLNVGVCRATLAPGGGYRRQLRWRNQRHLVWGGHVAASTITNWQRAAFKRIGRML